MLATKSRAVMVLVAAGLLSLEASTSRAGGIISAGASGTLYYGGYRAARSSGGATLVLGGTIPISQFVPAAPAYVPPVPAYVPPAPAAIPAPAVEAPAPSYALRLAPIAAPEPPPAPAPVVTLPPVAVPNPSTPYDAFINFGTAPYADQGLLTLGNAQSWTSSPSLVTAYGHTPDAAELNDFSQAVLQRVESTFADSGLSITATLDPNAASNHTLSVVSGLSATTSPEAVGITRIGRNGFDFIDKLGYATSPDELMWAVAHNVAHELMHAFGGDHHLTPEGNNLDAPRSDWSILVDPSTKFSAASVAEMRQNLREGGLSRFGIGAEQLDGHPIGCQCPQCQALELMAHPVPEPTTIGLWGAAAAGILMIRRRRAR